MFSLGILFSFPFLHVNRMMPSLLAKRPCRPTCAATSAGASARHCAGLVFTVFTVSLHVEFNFRRQSVNGWTYVRLVRHLGSSSCVPTRVRNLVGDRIRLEGGVKIVRTIHGILVTIYTRYLGFIATHNYVHGY